MQKMTRTSDIEVGTLNTICVQYVVFSMFTYLFSINYLTICSQSSSLYSTLYPIHTTVQTVIFSSSNQETVFFVIMKKGYIYIYIPPKQGEIGYNTYCSHSHPSRYWTGPPLLNFGEQILTFPSNSLWRIYH